MGVRLMTPHELLDEIRQHGGCAEVAGDRLRLRAPRPLPDELLRRLRQHKAELLRLLSALSAACKDLTLDAMELQAELAPEDIAALRAGRLSLDELRAFAVLVAQRRQMDRGIRPDHYTETAICTHCGPVWLWFSGEVLGCPWCWNRASGKPIPRPVAVKCKDCANF